MFFTSPTSNIISTSFASVAMSRSDSRDSATSTTSTTSVNWERRPSTSSSFMSLTSEGDSSSRLRASSTSSGWGPSPYRSCLNNAYFAEEATSYLSDDDLLSPSDHDDAVESPLSPHKELSTEEQIELLRQYQQREAEFHRPANHQHHHGYRHHPKPEAWWQPPTTTATITGTTNSTQPAAPVRRPRAVRFASDQTVVTHASSKQSRRTSMGKRRPSATPKRST